MVFKAMSKKSCYATLAKSGKERINLGRYAYVRRCRTSYPIATEYQKAIVSVPRVVSDSGCFNLSVVEVLRLSIATSFIQQTD